eukprot:5135116-Pyramimonas_sp.AAC.1
MANPNDEHTSGVAPHGYGCPASLCPISEFVVASGVVVVAALVVVVVVVVAAAAVAVAVVV